MINAARTKATASMINAKSMILALLEFPPADDP
jgi:hypothetical protein